MYFQETLAASYIFAGFSLSCFENAMKPISHVEFSRQVKEYFGYDIKTVRFQGKPTKIYVRKDDIGEDMDVSDK